MATPIRILVSAPSAAGKDALLGPVLEPLIGKLHRTQSWTTKPDDGTKKYRHVTREEFMTGVEQGWFLEYKENFDYLYGTYIKDVPPGVDTISEIDAAAALKLKRKDPLNTRGIFILPPDYLTLERRHKARGRDTVEQIQKRLHAAYEELVLAEHFEIRLVNDDLSDATRRLSLLIKLLLCRSRIPPSYQNPMVLRRVQESFSLALA